MSDVLRVSFLSLVLLLSQPSSSSAAVGANHIDGAELSLAWAVPFVGMLLSIALLPLFAPRFWEHHFGKVAGAWAAAFLVPCAIAFGPAVAFSELLHTILLEYVPFILLLFALFVVAGGIRIQGNLVGSPNTNAALMTFGTLTASVLGTTGASMLLIRPMIRCNQDRRINAHVFIFFIFLVSNAGGALTPLGDPPLYLGFLKGIDFFWTVEHMLPPMLLVSAILLGVFYAVDSWLWRGEKHYPASEVPRQLSIEGLHNVLYLVGIITAVLMSGLWDTEVTIPVGDLHLPIQSATRNVVLLLLSYLSWKSTPQRIRVENAFTWLPIQEVALLFAGIFLTMIPALAILRAGQAGALAPLLSFVSNSDGQPNELAYFWLTGVLSSFLDNAPTYLVFFNLAGGDPEALMGHLAPTLVAISAGAVFMGANTYIGNAPNFMVKTICQERGIRMPSFFGYMIWSGAILMPTFVLVSLVFFR